VAQQSNFVHDFENNVGRQSKKYQASRGLSAIAELLVVLRTRELKESIVDLCVQDCVFVCESSCSCYRRRCFDAISPVSGLQSVRIKSCSNNYYYFFLFVSDTLVHR